MSDSTYRIKLSFLAIKNNPVLWIIPLLFVIANVAVALVVIVQLFVFWSMLSTSPALSFLVITFLLIIDLFIIIALNAYFGGIQYTATKRVIDGEQVHAKPMFRIGWQMFRLTLGIQLAKAVVMLVPMFILAAIVLITIPFSKTLALTLGIFFFFIYFLFVLAFYALNIYNYPILTAQKISGFSLINLSMRYSMKNMRKTLETFLIVVVLYGTVTAIIIIFSIPRTIADFTAGYVDDPTTELLVVVLSGVTQIITAFIQAVGSVIITFFIFYSYFGTARAKQKRRLPKRKQASQAPKKKARSGALRR